MQLGGLPRPVNPARCQLNFILMALGLVMAAGLAQDQSSSSSSTAGAQPAVTYIYGSGSWGTLANIFFLFSALFTDVLHVRVMLVLAYVCVCLQVSLGFPSPTWWGRNPQASTLQLGNILWFSVTLALQLYGLAVLVLDELPARLTGDDEMLWRLFYRRCGITKREFSHVLKLGQWRHFKAGQIVEQRDRDNPTASVIFKGALRLEDRRCDMPPIILSSGQVLNLHLCNLFGVYIGFEEDPDHRGLVIAETDVTLFAWDVPALLHMASGAASVAVPAYWRSFLLNVLALQYHRQQLHTAPFTSFGTPEPDPEAWGAGLVQTVDLTDPLRPEEQDRVTWRSVLHAVFGPLSVRVPRGIRHYANPKTGAMATARVLLAASMRQRHQTLPHALSINLDVALAQADQQVVQHLSSVLVAQLQDQHQHSDDKNNKDGSVKHASPQHHQQHQQNVDRSVDQQQHQDQQQPLQGDVHSRGACVVDIGQMPMLAPQQPPAAAGVPECVAGIRRISPFAHYASAQPPTGGDR